MPDSLVNECIENYIQFVIQDIRPTDIVLDQGFKALANYFITFDSKLGQVDVDSLLFHPTTTSISLLKICDIKREDLFNNIKLYRMANMTSATTDMWTDNYKK